MAKEFEYGEALGYAFKAPFKNPKIFWPLAIKCIIIFIVTILFFGKIIGLIINPSQEYSSIIYQAIVLFILYLLLETIYQSWTYETIISILSNKPIDLKKTLIYGLNKSSDLFILNLITMFIILLAWLIMIAPIVITIYTSSLITIILIPIGIILGFAILLTYSSFFNYTKPFMYIEDKGVSNTLSSTYQFWKSNLKHIMLMYLISIAINMIISQITSSTLSVGIGNPAELIKYQIVQWYYTFKFGVLAAVIFAISGISGMIISTFYFYGYKFKSK